MSTQRRKRQLNPAFAAAHGLSNDSQSTTRSRIDEIVAQARKTGKVQAANANLTSLQSLLEWPPISVDLSLDNAALSWENHVMENVTLLDMSDNALDWDDRLVQNYPALTTLRAKRCQLGSSNVKPLKHLITLDLSGNLLTTFNLKLLPESVRDLDLSANQLTTLGDSDGDEVALPNLVGFNVAENKLTAIPTLHAPCLQTMHCGNNQLTSLEFLWKAQTCLTTLEASRNRLMATLSRLPDILVSLDLSQNRLTSIQLLPKTLVRLVLNDNCIQELDLTNCHAVCEVVLNGNQLQQVPTSIDTCSRLKTLDLRNNHICDLPYTLGFLSDLQRLQLEGNPLRRLRSVNLNDTAAVLQVLRNRAPQQEKTTTKKTWTILGKTLSLENQQLVEFPLDLVQELQTDATAAERIKRLVLSGNQLSSLDRCLHAVPNLTILESHKNQLTSLPNLANICLVELHLSGNRLETLVDLPPSLQVLDVSWNRLSRIASLSPPVALRVLNLAGNRLSSIDSICPSLPVTLEVLNLSDNKLESLGDLPLQLAAHCPYLQTLLLNNNELRPIPLEICLLSSLLHIDLRGNPQHAIRYQILEKPCSEILLYMRNRMTPEQLERTLLEVETRKRGSAESKPAAEKKDATTTTDALRDLHPSSVNRIEPTAAAPKNDSASKEATREPTTAATRPAKPTAGEEAKIVAVTTSTESPLLHELRESVDKLSNELESNLSLTQAKRYATKKQLAMERSKLIREERRLKQQQN